MAVTRGATQELVAVLDEICAADPARLADAETIQTLHRQLERLIAATTRATAAFDAGRTWEAEALGLRLRGWRRAAACPS